VARLRKLFGSPPDRVAGTHVAAFRERLKEVAESFRPDVVQLEMDEMAQYLPALGACPARRILVAHEPGASAVGDYREAGSGLRRGSRALDELAWRRFSRRALGRIDTAVVFTERDAQALRGLAPMVPIQRIPITVELPDRPLDPRGVDPPALLFFGGYEHAANADAALRLIRSIFPPLRAEHPDLVLQLVGSKPTKAMTAHAEGGVVVTGEVPSVGPYLDAAAIVVAPLRLGGGMRVKVLETLAAGKALVASPRALEGLEVEPGREVLQAESDDEFRAAISELLADEEQRVALGRRARAWAEASLGWEAVADAYEALYRSLLGAEK
jgi:glycosyltransferase involved in cell wall biosynthesis